MSPANSPRGNALGALLGKQSLSHRLMARHRILVPGIEVRILMAQLSNEMEQRLDGSNPPGTCVSVA